MLKQVHEGLRKIFEDQFGMSSEAKVAVSDLEWFRIVHFHYFFDHVLRHDWEVLYYFVIHF
jgi:hypothetical protein